jgi:hypothetical protein
MNGTIDSCQTRIQTLRAELVFLTDRSQKVIERLQESEAKLARLNGTIVWIPRFDGPVPLW